MLWTQLEVPIPVAAAVEAEAVGILPKPRGKPLGKNR